ncbi:MAG: peptidylprolyl isomerase [Actinomycetes bacterium]
MANQNNARKRERNAARDAAVMRNRERGERRRKVIAVGAVCVVLLAVVGTIFAASNDKGTRGANSSTTSTTSALPGDNAPASTSPGPTVSVVPASAGATIDGSTPCPADDGSSPRTTLFSQPPPVCTVSGATYDAIITTSVGDLTMYLNSDLAPIAVNNFVVLARYHYYDGAPLNSIISRTVMSVGSDMTNSNGKTSPGYTLAGEYPKGGTIFPPGTLVMSKIPGQGDRYSGSFGVTLGEKAADLPADTTAFGLTLDGANTLLNIDRAGTPDGGPTELITITSVRIKLAPVTTTTSR